MPEAGPPLPRFARGPVLAASAVAMLVLTVFSGGYGYHRDELYFRMLPPDLGYTDQPFLTPWLARTVSALVADEVWAVRIPATLAAGAAVALLALLTRELGGGRRAQAIAAWGYAGTASLLMFGHVLLPATLDLALWLAVLLAATRAALRDPRWWLLTGVLIGLTTWNRWLVVVLALAIAVGVLLLGPREALRSPWAWGGVAASLLVSAPNLAFQATHDWPQLAMGAALGENNAGEVRLLMWPLLFLLLGPALVPTCVSGIRHLWTDPALRHARFLLVCLLALVLFTFVGGTQPHYFMTPLAAVFAAGCVRLGERIESYRQLAVPFGLNAAFCALLGLPLLPLAVLGSTPVPTISPLAADQVGWPAYTGTVARHTTSPCRSMARRWRWSPPTTARPARSRATGRSTGCRPRSAVTTTCTSWAVRTRTWPRWCWSVTDASPRGSSPARWSPSWTTGWGSTTRSRASRCGSATGPGTPGTGSGRGSRTWTDRRDGPATCATLRAGTS